MRSHWKKISVKQDIVSSQESAKWFEQLQEWMSDAKRKRTTSS